VIVGQGGSALRGMAFGKPLVVVGEDGFSELLTPDSAPLFLRQGWYGAGPGSLGSGPSALGAALEALASSSALRGELGAFARDLVVGRFGLQHAAEVLESEYAHALGSRLGMRTATDLTRCARGVIGTKIKRKYQRRRGIVAVDDANQRPLTLSASAAA
jgi:phosphatidyl-myo-inositol alpha-mannosyltransferase